MVQPRLLRIATRRLGLAIGPDRPRWVYETPGKLRRCVGPTAKESLSGGHEAAF